jgi:hypothetical protein
LHARTSHFDPQKKSISVAAIGMPSFKMAIEELVQAVMEVAARTSCLDLSRCSSSRRYESALMSTLSGLDPAAGTAVSLRPGNRDVIVLTRQLAKRLRHLIGPVVATLIITISLIAALACRAGALPAAAGNLYRAQAIVTGQGEANRIIGFAACLEDVLIKVSGALKLAGDPRLGVYKSRSADFVSGYSYHDQMSGTPKRDEQGTRDRPYDLVVDFEDKKIDDILKSLGLKPWLSRRPVLAVFVGMEQGSRQYIATSDAKQSDLQRDSLLAAALKWGMTIVLPDVAALAKANINAAELLTTPPRRLASLAAERGGEVILVGRLKWDDSELGWATEWRMDRDGRTHRWQLRRVTFDEAFRRGIGGAAQILSGNGDPG